MNQEQNPKARRMPNEVERQLREGAERIALAQQGAYRCDKCKNVRKLHDGIVTFYRGQPVNGLCPRCFGDTYVVIKRTDQGIRITSESSKQGERRIQIVQSLGNLKMPRPGNQK